MFSAGVIAESQSASVKVLVVVKTGKVGATQYGATTRNMEQGGGGTAFTRAGAIQDYTEARADANGLATSGNADPQILDINIKGNLYRCVRIMNHNDIGLSGVRLELSNTIGHLSKTDIQGISTELGFLPSSGSDFSTSTLTVICEPFEAGVSRYVSIWGWDAHTANTVNNPNVTKPYDNILGFVSGVTKTVEIIL